MKICHNCGKSIMLDTSICPYCGYVLDAPIDFPRDEFLVSDSTLVKYIEKNKNVKVPFGIKEIGCRAFRDCENIQTITLPDGLETIALLPIGDFPPVMPDVNSESFILLSYNS